MKKQNRCKGSIETNTKNTDASITKQSLVLDPRTILHSLNEAIGEAIPHPPSQCETYYDLIHASNAQERLFKQIHRFEHYLQKREISKQPKTLRRIERLRTFIDRIRDFYRSQNIEQQSIDSNQNTFMHVKERTLLAERLLSLFVHAQDSSAHIRSRQIHLLERAMIRIQDEEVAELSGNTDVRKYICNFSKEINEHHLEAISSLKTRKFVHKIHSVAHKITPQNMQRKRDTQSFAM